MEFRNKIIGVTRHEFKLPSNGNELGGALRRIVQTARILKLACIKELAAIHTEPGFFESANGRKRLWKSVKEAPDLVFTFVADHPADINEVLPSDWGSKGYGNVCIGVIVNHPDEMEEKLDKLRTIPAKWRLVILNAPITESDLVEKLKGIHWVVCRTSPAYEHETIQVGEICEKAGVPFLTVCDGIISMPENPTRAGHPFGTHVDFCKGDVKGMPRIPVTFMPDCWDGCDDYCEPEPMMLPDTGNPAEQVAGPASQQLDVAQELPAVAEAADTDALPVALPKTGHPPDLPVVQASPGVSLALGCTREESACPAPVPSYDVPKSETDMAEPLRSADAPEPAVGTVSIATPGTPDEIQTIEFVVLGPLRDYSIITGSEPDEFARLNEIVKQAVIQSYKAGSALLEIRNRELWKAGGFKSWNDYCRIELKISKTQANRMIKAVEVTPIGVTPSPENESQVRPLAKLKTEDEQRAAWNRASQLAGGGVPSAKLVKQAVDELIGKTRDEAENPSKTRKELIREAYERVLKSVTENESKDVTINLLKKLGVLLGFML